MGTRALANPRTVILIDYGLSREHFDNGKPKAERKASVSWVGSRHYMSLNTHSKVTKSIFSTLTLFRRTKEEEMTSGLCFTF